MTSCDKRLEELLNRAGQTISDLPKKEGTEASEPYPLSDLPKANGAAWNWYLNIGADMEDYDSTRSKMVLKLYILHLTDIIDRMENALINLVGERDYLGKRVGEVNCDCDLCVYADVNEAQMPCCQCDLPPAEKFFRFAGVPENWREDDAEEV